MPSTDPQNSFDTSQLVNVNQNGVVALNAILQAIQSLTDAVQAQTTALQAIFPVGTGTSSSATTGSATLPADPEGFINVTLPDTGAQARVPYYNP